MNFIFDNDRPIYIQLVDQLKEYIVSGKFKAGEKLPSVREFAMQIKVNPNTVQKALAEIENQQLIYTERTNGKFVTTDVELIENMRKGLAREFVKNYLKEMQDIGLTHKDAVDYLLNLKEDNL